MFGSVARMLKYTSKNPSRLRTQYFFNRQQLPYIFRALEMCILSACAVVILLSAKLFFLVLHYLILTFPLSKQKRNEGCYLIAIYNSSKLEKFSFIRRAK